MYSPSPSEIRKAVHCVREGKVIAYPTESVYGFGCDPHNAEAISQILRIKNRPLEKGFILVASDWQQVQSFVLPLESQLLSQIFASWPGPVTWLFPAKPEVPAWIRGNHNSIAIRVSAHPIVRALCEELNGPLISTSANRNGEDPARDYHTVQNLFGDKLGYVLQGEVGALERPTEIRDALTSKVIRKG
jgi:L-threonylcarbamoyladenylate synthase